MTDNLFSLKNKIVIITGAAGLMGEKHVEAIISSGGKPILIDINKKKLNYIEKKINKKYSVKIDSYIVDITNESRVKSNANYLEKKYSKIDGLINNAANNPSMNVNTKAKFSRLESFPLNQWDQDILVGLTGAFLCCKYYGFIISKNFNGGSIINISSDLGLISPDQRLYEQNHLLDDQQEVKPISYSVVKTGLLGLTRYLATYWANKNVRCNAICPGGIKNDQSEEFINKVNKRIPLGRMAKPNEYQGAIIWLLSEASSYLNGSIIPIDGGRTTW